MATDASARALSTPVAPGIAVDRPRPILLHPAVRPYHVSVVIPTRNRSRLLAEAIRSVQAIDGPDLNLEIIVVDNGSTDDTEQVARALGTNYLRATKPGAAATRNVGIRAATGEFIAFLDDDDVWLPGHLRPQLELLTARPDLAACIGQIIPVDEAERPLADPYPVSLPPDGDAYQAFLGDFPQIGAFVVRTSVRETVGYQDDKHIWGEDWDWFLRIALEHRVGHVPVPAICSGRGRSPRSRKTTPIASGWGPPVARTGGTSGAADIVASPRPLSCGGRSRSTGSSPGTSC